MKTTVMPNFCPLVFCILFLICNDIVAQTNKPLTTGSVEYNSNELERLLPRDSKIEVIGSGFQHIESPLWIKDSNMLLFSDTKGQVIYRWTELEGTSKFLQHTGFTGRFPYSEEPGSNGLALTQNNELLICEHGDRRIALYPLNGKYGLRTVTDNFEGKRLNSPNDILVTKSGLIYFTDPPYGLPNKNNDLTKETKSNGVYCIDKDGKMKLLIDSLIYPNGLALSPDGKQMYVSISDMKKPHILVYDIQSDGGFANGKLFFDASSLPGESEKEVTDGLKTDADGNVWSSGPGGLLIISPQGKLLGRIYTGEIFSNCAWGNDGSTLYITAGSFLYRIKTKAKGWL